MRTARGCRGAPQWRPCRGRCTLTHFGKGRAQQEARAGPGARAPERGPGESDAALGWVSSAPSSTLGYFPFSVPLQTLSVLYSGSAAPAPALHSPPGLSRHGGGCEELTHTPQTLLATGMTPFMGAGSPGGFLEERRVLRTEMTWPHSHFTQEGGGRGTPAFGPQI